MSAFLRRYWASLTGARIITPREETMSTTTETFPVIEVFSDYRPITAQVMVEVVSATEAFPPMRSGHEGWAILFEEVDELWDEVRAKNDGSDQDRNARMRKEAIQVAAMALRFIHDVCGDA